MYTEFAKWERWNPKICILKTSEEFNAHLSLKAIALSPLMDMLIVTESRTPFVFYWAALVGSNSNFASGKYTREYLKGSGFSQGYISEKLSSPTTVI